MLSSKAKYGLKAMVYLARNSGPQPVLISEIAEKERLPKKFLDAILLQMKQRGLLISKKGKGGGYNLAKPASEISLGDIIRLLDGPLAPVPCVSRTAYQRCADCGDENACTIRAVMREVRDAITAILDNTSLETLAAAREPDEFVLNFDI